MKLTLAAAVAAVCLLSACGDGGGDTVHETRTAPSGDEINDADVEFATEMIRHHAEALAMVDLTLGRELDPEVAQLAEEIRMAQSPEIEQLTSWLVDWGEPIPETVRDHANAHDGGSDTAGLEALDGDEFQRTWLELMIEHHEGAIEMAESELEQGHFAPAIELADQIATSQDEEIDTMQDLLTS